MLKCPTIIKTIPMTIVTWANGTDGEISRMIKMADAGIIDLHDYWSVGDERTVHLSAMTAGVGLNTAQPEQDVVLVLMDTGANSGYKDINDNAVNFVVGQKNCLAETGRMKASDTNNGSWHSSAIRTDLNNKYLYALPVGLRSCLKEFKTVTAQSYNGTTNKTSNDYIALFAEKEVKGETGNKYSNDTERDALTQIEYYKTAVNAIKQRAGSNASWWLRSPYKENNTDFCLIYSTGNSSHTAASTTTSSLGGIAPFMCI